jgi:hypothetical protein
MNETPCIRPDDLDDVLALAEHDPRRRHLETCPACRSLIDAYALYGAAEAAPHEVSAAQLADADRRLAQALEREIGPAAATSRAPVRERRESWLERLFQPTLRPAWGLAAVAVVLVAVSLWPRTTGRDGEITLRQDGGASTEFAIEHARADGERILVAWSAQPDAEAYRLRFYSADLTEVGRLDAGPAREVSLPRDSLGWVPQDPSRPLLVRVFALSGGDEIGASAAVPIEHGATPR